MLKNLKTLFKEHPDRFHLFIVMCILQILDILTTQSFMARGGTEGNPLMAWVIDQGWGYAWGVKLLVMTLIPMLAIRKRKALIFLIYIYMGVIINNVLLIRHLAIHG